MKKEGESDGRRFSKPLRTDPATGAAAASGGGGGGGILDFFQRGSGKGGGGKGGRAGGGKAGGHREDVVAITGAAGFLGQLARKECEAMGLKVLGFDLPNPKCQGGPGLHGSEVASKAKKVDVELDLAHTKPDMLAAHLAGCSHVVHLAADGRPSADFVKDVMPNNIQATFNVLEAAKLAGVRRVVFASSNHTQHGETMGGASGMDWEKLKGMGGPGSVRLGDPFGVAGPDSFYGISKVTGEAMGYYFARVQKSFDFVALRIGWCLYDSAERLNGTSNEDYLKAMYLSHRDFRGFLHASLVTDVAADPFNKFLVAYAVSNNSNRLFDLDESIRILGYTPQDGYEGPVDVKRKPATIDLEAQGDALAQKRARTEGARAEGAGGGGAAGGGGEGPAAAGGAAGGAGAEVAGASSGARGGDEVQSAAGAEAGPKSAGGPPDWDALATLAEAMRSIYRDGYGYPAWSIEMLRNGQLPCGAAVVYYREGDSLDEVKLVAIEREPCNIMMRRLYSPDRLEKLVGHRTGRYAASTKAQLQPNIAIFCRTPIRSNPGPHAQIELVNVINVIGYAFDAPNQPDYEYFLPLTESDPKWKELVGRFSQMWRFIFECAQRKGYKRIYLADVGGGAFSEGLNKRGPGYLKLKEASLEPIKEEYKDRFVVEQLPRIPDFAFQPDNKGLLDESLLVNAWDPWSMVGNGNFGDNSLDGFFGRCTAMAVLCWPKTNPYMKWEAVKSDW